MNALKTRTEIHIEKSGLNITHQKKVMLIGSCFAENISQKLAQYKFDICSNPFGILFNPASITQCLNRLISKQNFKEDELIFFNNEWISLLHHGDFSNQNKAVCLENICEKFEKSADFLEKANILIITLGTNLAYRLKTSGQVVSNCHKIPASEFIKEYLSLEKIIFLLEEVISKIRTLNPDIHVIFTLSPVRYIKDDFVKNSIGKASLLMAINHFLSTKNVSYFPAYEIMMDDLRDYRFYNSDMIHPSAIAIDYIWDCFSEMFFDEETKKLNNSIRKINEAYNHNVKNTDSEDFLKFKESQMQKINFLLAQHPFLNFKEEMDYFG